MDDKHEYTPRFKYCLDPVCIVAVLIYGGNRWWIGPSWIGHIGFFHNYLNDVLCIPVFLPPVLLAHRWLRLRSHDHPPTPTELLFHLFIWATCFEAIAPRFPDVYCTTADPLDVAAYTLGAAIASLVWRSWRTHPLPATPVQHVPEC
jgi:hypothetical protein